MAEETRNTNGNGEPPKIKLTNGNGNLTPPPPAEPVKPVAPGKTPPKIIIKSAEKKSDTARIDLASAQPPTPSSTGPATGPKRVTIRVTRPLTTPKTTSFQKPATPTPPSQPAVPALEEQKKKSETTRLSMPTAPKPSEEATSITMPPSPTATAEAKKSETARIELPTGATDIRPATRPKTIRIKRPDAAGATVKKSLTINRAPSTTSAAATIASTTPSVEAQSKPATEVGTVFALVAIFALIITAVLVYVLMAQTVAPGLSFPGKII